MNNLLMADVTVYIEIVTAVVLVAYCIFGVFRGFASMFISFFSTILSLIFAILLCAVVAEFLQESTSLVSTTTQWVEGVVNKILGDDVANTKLIYASADELERAGVSQWIISIVLSIKSDTQVASGVTVSQVVAPVFGYYVACIISAVVLFILFKILFFIISRLIIKIHKIPVVGVLDRILGGVLGIVKGVSLIQIVILLLGIIPLSFAQDITIQIAQTSLTKFIDDINLFDIILKALSDVKVLDVVTGILK